MKEIAKAAKNAVKARKNQQRRKARRSWDLEQEEKSRLQARADADASYLEAERLRIEMEEARENSMRAKQEKQREAIRRKSEEKALRELEKKRQPPREALRLEKLGEKQKAAELREQARKEAQQEQARLKREAAAAREFSLKKKQEDKLRAKAESADRKRRLMEGKVEEAERRRLLDIEQKAAAAKARRRSCAQARPAPLLIMMTTTTMTRKMLGSIARESYDDFSYASTQPLNGCVEINQWRIGCSPRNDAAVLAVERWGAGIDAVEPASRRWRGGRCDDSDAPVDFHTGHHPKIVRRRASRRPRRMRRSRRPRCPTGTRRPTRQAIGATGRRRREASRGPFGVMEAKLNRGSRLRGTERRADVSVGRHGD